MADLHTAQLAIRTAVEEDRLNLGSELPPHLVGTVDALLRIGRPTEASLQDPMQSLFGCDLSSVRVCTGSEVDAVLDTFRARACCVKHGIFIRREVADAEFVTRVEVLAHELAHLCFGSHRNTIRFWNPSGHKELTREQVYNYFTPSFGTRLVAGSWKMDIPNRYAQLEHALEYGIARLTHSFPLPRGGPDHGEGGSAEVNEARQSEYVAKAAEAYVQIRQSLRTRGAGDEFGAQLRLGGVVKHLGDALHVAQDRGSHGEGAPGKGHDDKRYIEWHIGGLKPGWDWHPDDINLNDEGRLAARKNTKAVFEEFTRKVKPKKGNWLDSLVFRDKVLK